MKKIRVFVKTGVEDEGTDKFIDDTLENLQAEVKGHIELVYLSEALVEREITCYANELGKIERMPAHLWLIDRFDILAGPIIFVKYDDKGQSVSLDDEDIILIKDSIEKAKMSYIERRAADLWIQEEF